MPRLTLDELRVSKSGHSHEDYVALLEAHGYHWVRNTRHGARYSHAELAKHPDVEVRRDRSWVLVPFGRSLLQYVANDVIASIDFLLTYLKEKEQNV